MKPEYDAGKNLKEQMDGPSKRPQLKVIKRIMYGRNSFELLKAKVLLHEQFRCEIN